MTGFTWRVSTRKLDNNKEGNSDRKKDKHRKGKHGGRWQMAGIWWTESSVEMVKSDSSPPWVSDYARIVHPKEDLHTSCCVSGLEQANEASFEDKSQQIIFPSQQGGGGAAEEEASMLERVTKSNPADFYPGASTLSINRQWLRRLITLKWWLSIKPKTTQGFVMWKVPWWNQNTSHSNTLCNFINDMLNNRREIKIIIVKFHLCLLVNDNETYDQKALVQLFQCSSW